MFLLDTNVVSELRKAWNGGGDQAVRSWASAVAPEKMFLSVISVMEIEIGIRGLERRDQRQAGSLQAWLEQRLLPAFSARLLPVDTAVARRCAALHVPDPGGERDSLIAATALVHGLAVVTRNTSDFLASGVTLINPWQPAEAASP